MTHTHTHTHWSQIINSFNIRAIFDEQQQNILRAKNKRYLLKERVKTSRGRGIYREKERMKSVAALKLFTSIKKK